MVDPVVYVTLGGSFGAVSRHLVGEMVDDTGFPVSTLAVNVLGSLALGLLAFGNAGTAAFTTFGTGACGAFTTFSSFSFETVRLYETGARARAFFNAGVNLIGSLTAIGLAWGLTGIFL
ncbi:MAG: CrcB family protein [Halobacteria archaeon]